MAVRIILWQCVQAQKKNVKTFARAEKKHSRVNNKKHAPFQMAE